MKLHIKKETSIRQKVYQQIRQKILNGEVSPNERLVETRLAKEIGTSRTPVREALHALEREKLVRCLPRVGYVVEGLSNNEIEQICEIRGVIEQLALRWAIERTRPKLIKQLAKIIANQEKELERGNLLGYAELDGQFHETIARLSGSERLLELSQTLRQHMLRYRAEAVYAVETALRSLEGHKRILRAIEQKVPDTIDEAIRDHLKTATEDILQYVLHENNRNLDFGSSSGEKDNIGD